MRNKSEIDRKQRDLQRKLFAECYTKPKSSEELDKELKDRIEQLKEAELQYEAERAKRKEKIVRLEIQDEYKRL